MEWNLQTIEVLGLFLGALASFVAIMKWFVPWMRAGVGRMFGNHAVNERLDELSEQISYLVKEMKLNGGHSIRDQLTRVEEYVVMTNEIQHARMLDSDHMIFRTDREGRVEWVNRTFARTVQRLPQELVNHGWFNCLAQEERDSMMQRWENAVREGMELEQVMLFQTPDGDQFPVTLRTYRMDNARDEMIGFLGTATLN